MTKVFNIKVTKDDPTPEGLYRLTYDAHTIGGGGQGTFWFDVGFSQLYRSSDPDGSPAADTEEAVAAFLEDWIEEDGLYEVLYNLELLEITPVSLKLERMN